MEHGKSKGLKYVRQEETSYSVKKRGKVSKIRVGKGLKITVLFSAFIQNK